MLLRLTDGADVLVENFRPGTIERLGLGPDVLLERNPRLVVLRVTGFGQDGPYAGKPGFATIAEAMSGFAAINGEPDGAPLLPPIALTDEVAALAGAFAVMVALHERDTSGRGQVVDVNLLESMVQMMSALPSAAAHLDYQQPRLGSGIPYSVPARDVPVRRRRVDRDLDLERVRGAPRAHVARRRPTTRGSRRSSRAPGTARSSTGSSANGWARVRAPTCSRRSTRCRPRSRPCTRCTICSWIPTWWNAACSWRSTGS